MPQLAHLELPARAEFVSLARLVVSSLVGDRYELSDEQLDDLKLAVSEACVMVIEAQDRNKSAAMVLDCEGRIDGVDVIVEGPSGFVDSESVVDAAKVDGVSGVGNLGFPLIKTLVDQVDFESGGSSTRLRMGVNADTAELL